MKKTSCFFFGLSLIMAIFVGTSQTAHACMLASGCESTDVSLNNFLNQDAGISGDSEDEELPPLAVLRVTNDSGNRDPLLGTTNTIFTFDGTGSQDAETSTYNIEVRFDFENDGKLDTYYSHFKQASHKYETPGLKMVKMNVLDGQGNVATAYETLLIVENTPPKAYFTISPLQGTPATKFIINTRGTFDSQYNTNLLEYRFDFDGDGKFDTKFQNKTVWQHKFGTVGEKTVTLEVRDPEGATSKYIQKVTIIENTPPKADFISEIQYSNEKTANYKVDASQSTDPDGGKLKYKWDYNYTGETDIIWDTVWTSSPLNFANFYKAGEYLIKLMVKDEDGAMDSKIVKIIVDLIKTSK
jgi:hypothetical protein